MSDFIKNFTFLDIETLFNQIAKTEFSLLDHLTSQMQADLELLKTLEKLKVELTNLICVK